MERVTRFLIVLSQGWGCFKLVRENFIDTPSSSTCVLPGGSHSAGSYQRKTDGASLAAEGRTAAAESLCFQMGRDRSKCMCLGDRV